VTTLHQLRNQGPFAPIFTPVFGADSPTDAWLTSHTPAPA